MIYIENSYFQIVNFVDFLTARIVKEAVDYEHLFLLPVNLRAMELELCESKDNILLIKTQDY